MRILLVLTILITNTLMAQTFQPYSEHYKRLVQGVSFSPDGTVMYFTLPHLEFLNATGQKTSEETPRLAMYQAKREGDSWGTPELLPFSGIYKNYEPTISPDGKILLFNSDKPVGGGAPLEKNNIWFSVMENNEWQEPRSLTNVNTPDYHESYASITKDGYLIYISESDNDEYSVRITKFEGENTLPGEVIQEIDFPIGTGDPWIASDGSYLIYTKYDVHNWNNTCDLYISFKKGNSWTKPVAIQELNGSGPDFSVAVSPDEEWIYYRRNYQYQKLPFKEILKKYRSL